MLDDIYGQEEDDEMARDIFVPGQENNFAASQKISSNRQQYLRKKPNTVK
jgi:hypothetical protein